jgi:proline racemase
VGQPRGRSDREGLELLGPIQAVDYHTAGEPFRIVTGGVPPLEGSTILEKRRFAAERLDEIRRLLVLEPRGDADMYGCFVTEAEAGADLGVVFFHNAGYSTACGHGTIALVTWALETGVVVREGPDARVVVDVPSGRVETVAHVEDGRVVSVAFRNVPAFVVARGARAAGLTVDVAYGGAFYASVEAPLPVDGANVPRFIELGRQIKDELETEREFVHPEEPELRDIYGVIFWQDEGEDGGRLVQRSVTVFADGEVDRSPCGSGTSARLALLGTAGELRGGELPERSVIGGAGDAEAEPVGQSGTGRELLHRSVIGTEFVARIVSEAEVAGLPAVVTEVEGSAHYTGRHEFTLDSADPLGPGFLLR